MARPSRLPLTAVAAALALAPAAHAQDQTAAIEAWLDQLAANVPAQVTWDSVDGTTVTNLRLVAEGALLIGSLELEGMDLDADGAPIFVGSLRAEEVSFGSRKGVIYAGALELNDFNAGLFFGVNPQGRLMMNLPHDPAALLLEGVFTSISLQDLQLSSGGGREAARITAGEVSLSIDRKRFFSVAMTDVAGVFASARNGTIQGHIDSFEIINVDPVPPLAMMLGFTPPMMAGAYPANTGVVLEGVSVDMLVQNRDDYGFDADERMASFSVDLERFSVIGERQSLDPMAATATMDLVGLEATLPQTVFLSAETEIQDLVYLLAGEEDAPLELAAHGAVRATVSQEDQAVELSEMSLTVEDMARINFTTRFVIPNASIWEGMNNPAVAANPQYGMAVATNMGLQSLTMELEDLGAAERLGLYPEMHLGLWEMLEDLGRSMAREESASLHAFIAQFARFWADPGKMTITVTSKSDAGLPLAMLPMMGPERTLESIDISIEVE